MNTFYLKQIGFMEGYSRGYFEGLMAQNRSLSEFITPFFNTYDPHFIIIHRYDPLTYVVSGGYPKGNRKVGLFYNPPPVEEREPAEQGVPSLHTLLSMPTCHMLLISRDGRHRLLTACNGMERSPHLTLHLFRVGTVEATHVDDLRLPFNPATVCALLRPLKQGVYEVYEGRREDLTGREDYAGRLTFYALRYFVSEYKPIPVLNTLPTNTPLLFYPQERCVLSLSKTESSPLPPYFLRFTDKEGIHRELL